MAAVGAWLVAVWQGVGIGSTILKAAASLALNFAVAKLTAPRGPRPRDLQTELRQSNAPRVRHLGRVRASGAVMFWDWAQVGGVRVLFKLLAVGQGGITAVEQVWLNDKPVTIDADAVTTEPWNGHVIVRSRTGRGGQLSGGAYPTLQSAFPDQWTEAHRLNGVGTILGEFDAVKSQNIAETYSGGDPSITALFRGDACYNPFTGSSAWSANPAAQLQDVLTNPQYGTMTADDLHETFFAIAAADNNDAIPLAGGGTIPRYTSGCSYQLSEPMKDVAERLLDSFAGRLFVTAEGKIGVRSGKWRAPNFTITEDKIVGIDIGPGSGEMERVTTLIPRYVAPETDWQETTATPWDDAAAIALYGESVAQELDLPCVQHHGQARRLAKIQIAKMNPAWRATIKLRFWGLLLLEEENVYLDLPDIGLTNAPAWIDSFAFDMNDPEGVCTVSLISADPSSFDWNAGVEEGDPPSKPDAIDHHEAPLAAPVAESLDVVTGDGAPYIAIQLQPPPDTVYVRAMYFREPDGPKYTMTPGVETAGNEVWRTDGLQDRGQYTVELTYTNTISPWEGGLSGSYTIASPTTTISGIEVFENTTPPDPPVVVAHSGAAGGTFSVTFEPDLGVNYEGTELWRGALGSAFADAIYIKTSFAKSSQVTMSAAVPVAGARFWIVSINPSGVPSASVFVRSAS